jgi:hypothetical protein
MLEREPKAIGLPASPQVFFKKYPRNTFVVFVAAP